MDFNVSLEQVTKLHYRISISSNLSHESEEKHVCEKTYITEFFSEEKAKKEMCKE